MNENLLLHIIAAVAFSILALFFIDLDRHTKVKQHQWYARSSLNAEASIVMSLLFPFLMLIRPQRAGFIVNIYCNILLNLLLLTSLLLALTPWLRKHITAQSCAELWILPCSIMYISVFLMRIPLNPWLVIRLPRAAVRWILIIWLVGFLAVIVWKIAAHLRFRKTILQNAVKAPEHVSRVFREVWNGIALVHDEKHQALNDRIVASRPLVFCSADCSSPLTVGLFKRTACLILPEKEYDDEELRLLFRHETIHLLRADNFMKFTITFLCAMCWFAPSLWIGMRRASEDIELCCDELATAGMQESARRGYANLLLQSAGTEKGFTTCLSASAKGLRYRLKYILHPVLRSSGLAVLGLLLSIFLFCFGMFGVKVDAGTMQTEIKRLNGGSWRVTEIENSDCKDPSAAADMIKDLPLSEPYWDYDNGTVGGRVRVTLELADGRSLDLYFTENTVYLTNLSDFSNYSTEYLIEGTIDLDQLRSMAAEAD